MIMDFKKRFWISMVLSMPIILLAPMIQELLGFELSFEGDRYLQFGLASIIYFYGGWPFIKGSFDELNKKSPGMMTLIALAISVAYLYSVGVVLGLKGKTLFWELAGLIDIMLLGHWLEAYRPKAKLSAPPRSDANQEERKRKGERKRAS